MGVYNEQAHLTEAIDSILAQTYEDFEFVIIDDASTDDSPEIVRSYNDPRITLLENETNQGLTYSLNRALKHATGTYVARQDADDVSEPDRFERQIRFLETNSEVAVVGTGATLIDGDGNTIDKRIGYCNPTFEDFMQKGHLIHGSIMARRSVLQDVGGYDEFFQYAQDQELWLRLSKQHSLANISEPLYRLRLHDGSVYFSKKDESAMFIQFAQDLATNTVGSDMKTQLESDGILAYYEELDTQRRVDFHCDLATRYLRYGHIEQARKECQKARSYDPSGLRPILLSGIARTTPKVTRKLRWAMRRYLNFKLKLLNKYCQFNMTN